MSEDNYIKERFLDSNGWLKSEYYYSELEKNKIYLDITNTNIYRKSLNSSELILISNQNNEQKINEIENYIQVIGADIFYIQQQHTIGSELPIQPIVSEDDLVYFIEPGHLHYLTAGPQDGLYVCIKAEFIEQTGEYKYTWQRVGGLL